MYYSDINLLQQQACLFFQANQLLVLEKTIQGFLSIPLLQQQALPLTLPYQPTATEDMSINNNGWCYLNHLHPLYPLLYEYLQVNPYEIERSFNNKAIPPYCQLLFTCDKDLTIHQCINCNYITTGETFLTIKLEAVTCLEQLIQRLYQEHNNHWFNERIKAYLRSERANSKSYHQYVYSLFEKYSRLLVIRVDLGYYSNQLISYPQFCQDIDRFISLIPSNPVFKDKVGYIWKLEYGPQKGFHVHLLLFYDGAKRRSDYQTAKAIGELWQTITSPRGLYYNCHTKIQKQAYVINCLGMIHRSNTQKISHLATQVVSYLAKIDPCLKLLNCQGRKLTDRGQIPKLISYQ